MRFVLLVTLVLLGLFIGGGQCQGHAHHKRSIYAILECQDRFSKFVKAVKHFPDLLADLKSNDKELTLFVPDNHAFKKLDSIPTGEELGRTLRYHIAPNVIKLDPSLDREIFGTLLSEPVLGGPQRIKVDKMRESYVVNDRVHVTEANIKAINGMVHVISDVLLPPPDLLHRLAEAPITDSIFVDALALTDISHTIAEERITLFVPTNEAFEELPRKERERLFSREGRENLTQLLKRHVVPTLLYLGEMDQNEVKLNTLQEGVTLLLQRRNDKFLVNGVPVTVHDVFGNNGAINYVPHIVPEQLPPAPEYTENSLTRWLTSFRQWLKEMHGNGAQ